MNENKNLIHSFFAFMVTTIDQFVGRNDKQPYSLSSSLTSRSLKLSGTKYDSKNIEDGLINPIVSNRYHLNDIELLLYVVH